MRRRGLMLPAVALFTRRPILLGEELTFGCAPVGDPHLLHLPRHHITCAAQCLEREAGALPLPWAASRTWFDRDL